MTNALLFGFFDERRRVWCYLSIVGIQSAINGGKQATEDLRHLWASAGNWASDGEFSYSSTLFCFFVFISKQHLCWPRSIGRRAIWWVTAKAIKDALPIFINSSRHFLFFFFLFGRGGLGDLCFHLGCQLLPEQGAPVGRKSISVESDFVMDRQDLPPAKRGSPWAGSAFCRHFLCQCDAVEEKVSGLRFFWGGVRRVVYRLIL